MFSFPFLLLTVFLHDFLAAIRFLFFLVSSSPYTRDLTSFFWSFLWYSTPYSRFFLLPYYNNHDFFYPTIHPTILFLLFLASVALLPPCLVSSTNDILFLLRCSLSRADKWEFLLSLVSRSLLYKSFGLSTDPCSFLLLFSLSRVYPPPSHRIFRFSFTSLPFEVVASVYSSLFSLIPPYLQYFFF